MKIERLMRGQVVVREVFETNPTGLWTPAPSQREQKTHRGIVLGMGPPARTPTGHEVEPGFQIGDTIQFHFTSHQEAATHAWVDGKPATWIPQQNVDGVFE